MLSLQTGRVTGWRGDRNHHPLISPDYRPSVWACGFAGPMSDAAAVQITTEHAECGGCPAWRISQSVHEVASTTRP